ncbi:DUF4956 domain-containing protein [Paeniglutamicibacter gangotriensis]|uniref:DUF4956 domain-containing protein n=1 Tax=Paeniglutamicibacter gangotriensis Lz1y TaxID=1276920 RepID=M7NPP0_9MICC|nr:DUF4956 domain-containing protein [Paeniglutamicibacter gangotriensis]EMR00494.1 hypothetical protein ADIAG_00501 [Paeniglutamicibacter gangotriensis Lz1y]
MQNFWIALAANLIAMLVLVCGIYYRRHFRKDLALAYLALNFGIFGVTMLLNGSGAGAGLGLGLFGILSIIRLRSDTLTQEEVAYYFISLAIGLINGLHPDPFWLSPALSLAMVLVMFVADHPAFGRRTMRQTVTLDAAYAQQQDLHAALADLLNAKVLRTVVLELDMVRDLTIVDVRFRANTTAGKQQKLVDAPDIESIPSPAERLQAQRSGERDFAQQQGR